MEIEEISDPPSIARVAKLAEEIWHEYYPPLVGNDLANYVLKKFQTAEAIGEQIRNGSLYYFVKDGRAEAGYFCVQPGGSPGVMFLSKFYVKKQARGKGYGRKMLAFIEALAKRKGFERITLTVNKRNADSIKIYQKMGFEIAEAVVLDIGGGFVLDDYRMEKRLVP